MASDSKDNHEISNSPCRGVDKQQVPVESNDYRSKTPRNPRWTKQETFVLINGKKAVDYHVGRGRRSTISMGSDQLGRKWDSISSYCKQYGVNRGPIQCRKRWSNLLGDFKKIQGWELEKKDKNESFWIMRNDLRREKKLPGLFDREVYDAMDGKAVDGAAYPLTLVKAQTDSKNGDGFDPETDEEYDYELEETDTVLENGQNSTAMFSDFELSEQEDLGWSPEKETNSKGRSKRTATTPLPCSGREKEKHLRPNTSKESTCQEKWKRRRVSSKEHEATDNLENQITKSIERNSNILNAHLEAQNKNFQLDREQRKEQSDNLIAAISKLTDAVVKIADKL